MSTEVHLAIYDLSRGMARSLSTQFLGPNHAIDIMPHTGIIAFGKEYLFGSMGIDSMNPAEFRRSHQIFPMEVQFLGLTSKTQEEFEDWCSTVTQNGLYDGNNYDLFHRNCNNFSHDAAIQGFGLSRGVPTWILETPTRFLSSPLGQMITPILQQMQISGPLNSSNQFTRQNNAHVPFSSSTSSSSSTTATSHIHNPHNSNSEIINPWMNENQSKKDKNQKGTIINAPALSTPILDSHNSALLSMDKNSVIRCIDKLLDSNHASSSSCEVDSLTFTLSQLRHDLNTGREESSTIENSIHLLISILQQHDGTKNKSDILYSLIILRMLVIYIKENSKLFDYALSSLAKFLLSNTKDDSPITSNHSNLCMMWCVMSNLIGSIHRNKDNNNVNTILDPDLLMKLIDQAVGTLNEEKYHGIPQIRQMVSAFLYNTAYYLTTNLIFDSATENNDEYFLNDCIVSLLCGTMEGLAHETDSITELRRLMVIGKLLHPRKQNIAEKGTTISRHFEHVAKLFLDLGFSDSLTLLLNQRDNTETTELDKSITEFTRELVSLMLNLNA